MCLYIKTFQSHEKMCLSMRRIEKDAAVKNRFSWNFNKQINQSFN